MVMVKRVRKVLKTKKKPTETQTEESTELPSVKSADVDDVSEGHKIFDMSDIPTPVITFALPNLSSSSESKRDVEKPEKTALKKKKKGPAASSSSEKRPMTAQALNNEIVCMRKVIKTAKGHLMGDLVRKKKAIDHKIAKMEISSVKKSEFDRKAQRLAEEIKEIKVVDKDTVSKFALLNKKKLNEFRIQGDTPVLERLMYKLACEDPVVKAVQKFREKYLQWESSTAFFLQRLGLQYSGKEEKKDVKREIIEKEQVEETAEKGSDDPEEDSEKESMHDSEEAEDGDLEEDCHISDIEICDSDEEVEAEAAEKRRALFLGLAGLKEDKSRPAPKAQSKKALESDEEEEIEKEPKKITVTSRPRNLKGTKAKKKKKEGIATKAPSSEPAKDEGPTIPSQAVVRRVNLSEGGFIAKETPDANVAHERKDSSDDEDEEAKSSFFVTKSVAATKRKEMREEKSKQKNEEVEVKRLRLSAPQNSNRRDGPATKKFGKGSSKQAQEEVHPSWAARMNQRKEQNVVPCGKKTIFADDD
ncbi:unnamed protein product [Caenorhabditis auriculariae]|uniref:SRF-dependent transcription regulation-associated protein n=1 Tax=Caenorhabditis auriculariae TaxID=2777116 RepID=A0A8S1H530_9PELO|nr:unnamed protein product [Caenorhabditis auriculariae]